MRVFSISQYMRVTMHILRIQVMPVAAVEIEVSLQVYGRETKDGKQPQYLPLRFIPENSLLTFLL